MNSRLAAETSPTVTGRSSAEFSLRVNAMPQSAPRHPDSFLAYARHP
jgi:hypothetical protein